MASAILKKAFDGDVLSMVSISSQIFNKTLSANDLNELLKPSRNTNQQCLYAFYLAVNPKNHSVDLQLAKSILEPMAAMNNSFALHFLSYIYLEIGDLQKSNAYAKSAIDLMNPLAIISEFSGVNLNVSIDTILSYAPFVYHSLIPAYQEILLNCLDRQLKNNYTPENCYAHALCYEKMGLYEKMFERYHNAIEYEPKEENKAMYAGKREIYQHKLVKKFEKIVQSNNHSLFKIEVNRAYVDKKLTSLLAKIEKIDAKVAAGDFNKPELDGMYSSLYSIMIAGKNHAYILRECASKSSPKHLESTNAKLIRLQAVISHVESRLNETIKVYQDTASFRKR